LVLTARKKVVKVLPTLNWLIPPLSALFLAISPWHLQFSRGAFEANVALFLVVCGTWLFLRAVRQNSKLFIPSLILYAFSFYTYHSVALSSPLLLLVLFILFRRELWSHKKLVLGALVLAALIILSYLPTYVFSVTGRI